MQSMPVNPRLTIEDEDGKLKVRIQKPTAAGLLDFVQIFPADTSLFYIVDSMEAQDVPCVLDIKSEQLHLKQAAQYVQNVEQKLSTLEEALARIAACPRCGCKISVE